MNERERARKSMRFFFAEPCQLPAGFATLRSYADSFRELLQVHTKPMCQPSVRSSSGSLEGRTLGGQARGTDLSAERRRC